MNLFGYPVWNSIFLVFDRFENPNGAVYLNNGYLILPNDIYFENTDFSITLWISLQSNTSYSSLLDFGNGELENNVIFGVFPYNSSFFASVIDDFKVNYILHASSPFQIQPNVWYHLAVVFQQQIGRIYLNGNEISSGPLSYPVNTARVVRKLVFKKFCLLIKFII